MADHFLPGLDPSQAARGAMGVMSLGNVLGFVPNDAMRAVRGAYAQSALVSEGGQIASNLLALAGNATASMTAGERMARLSEPTITRGIATRMDGTTVYETVPNPNFSPGMASFSKYGEFAGAGLSMASGALNAQGDNVEASKATGTAGGALSGAAIGTQIMPGWGTAIGAVIGAGVGYFSSGNVRKQGGGFDRGLYESNLREQMAERAERSAYHAAQSITQSARNLNIAFAGNRINMNDRLPQMLNYLRRPSSWVSFGNQSLVRGVESSIGRSLQPRW